MARLTEAQEKARMAILWDVARSGGVDRWSHLHSHGHRYPQVMACVRRGDLWSPRPYEFVITPAGEALLSERARGDGE